MQQIYNVIYKSYILPILDYCDTDLLEKLQRQAARIIMKSTCSDEVLACHIACDTLEAMFLN